MQNLFIPFSNFRRRRKSSMRPVFDSYRESLHFRREAKNWNDEQKRRWILDSLRFAVRRAAQETDYYADLFKQTGFDAEANFSFEDFSRIPVLERENISEAGEKIITKNIPREKLLKDATGGSTGTPTEIFLGAEERGWLESGIEFSFEKIGVPAGVKTAFLWGHHLDPQGADSFRDRLRSFMSNVRWFDSFRLSPEILQKYHEEFERWSPDCIVAYASALGQLAEFLRENNIRPRNYPKICFVTGAEKLYPEHRRIAAEVFGKPAHERYGGRDFGAVGIQTHPQKNLDYEIDWAWGLVEPETDAENSAILVTKLHADGMPMIRYRTGDVGKFPPGSYPGNPTFILHEIVGRELDRIWLKDKNWVSGAEFPHLIKSFAVREFVFVQSEDYSVELQIVPKNDFDEKQQREILQTIQANLKDLPVNLKLVEKIPRTKANKWRPVISKVKRDK